MGSRPFARYWNRGAHSIDHPVQSLELKSKSALRLLGARAVLTGVGPAVAQALVRLRVDLGGIIPYGSLQSGFSFAMRCTVRPPESGARAR